MSVQRIRLRPDEIGDAVEAARSFMRVTGVPVGSWWISEHSTPADLETRLLTHGLTIVEDDYSHVSYNARNEKTAEFDAFINRMQLDDIVVSTSGGAFYVG